MQQIDFGSIDADGDGPTIGDVMESRFAREIISTTGADGFDAIEISGCMFVAGDCVEPCTNPDDVPAFFSVYLHYAEGHGHGVECVGDFATAERARAYAAQIRDAFGWSVEIDRTAA
ncbi:hypothetical protein AH2_0002 [Burkholderia phage vB_BceS_AH2]|uniref:Uncharacterized protein n=1 Tax=Burkholderia phage vB_BceS_AH2 TaxID=1133022 RepID=I6NP76_9CAUD|nr:hypothetical protein B613_gp02 [Burkholderia phage vB_BceS_AH2]AEY69513.1 hypothetical protein AH2_0002 [Burkholderia phage vB_BceS_AH2]